MKFPRIEIEDDVIVSLSKKYHIKKLSFFGSILREDFNENSDIDILIEFIDEKEYSLEQLLSGITEQNCHAEIDTGSAVGKEDW